MKLAPAETRKLVATTDGRMLDGIIDDACEMLTLKVVLWLQRKRQTLQSELTAVEVGTAGRLMLASQINLLGKLTVELAEAP